MSNSNNQVSLKELGKKVGLEAPFSMSDVAAKIGYNKQPIKLSELAKEVDNYLKKK